MAFNTNGINMLEGRRDLSVLWDIRVQPEFRGRGIGRALFLQAAEWSRERGCRQMKVETQAVYLYPVPQIPFDQLYAKVDSGTVGLCGRTGEEFAKKGQAFQ